MLNQLFAVGICITPAKSVLLAILPHVVREKTGLNKQF